MKLKRYTVLLAAIFAAAAAAASQPVRPVESQTAPGRSTPLTMFSLDADASGVIQTINDIVNLTVSSRDPNDLWSESLWKWQTLRDVPDRLDGHFTLMPIYPR